MRTTSQHSEHQANARWRPSPAIGGSTLLALLILLTITPGAAACLAVEANCAARTALREPVQRTISLIRSARVRSMTADQAGRPAGAAPMPTRTIACEALAADASSRCTLRIWATRAGAGALPPPRA